MATAIALMRYPVLAPTDVATPVVTASAVDGNPIEAKPAKMPGWTFMTLKLRPIDEFKEGVNWSLIATRVEPKQTADTEGSQGGYLKSIRARTHTWLQGGGDFKLVGERMGEYKAMEASATVPGREWGLPRKTGKGTVSPPTDLAPPGVRGKDKGKRRPRRDRYLVLVAPDGSELPMLPRSKHARIIADAGYPVPDGWRFAWRDMDPPMAKRPVLWRLARMPGYGAGVVPFELFLKGRNPGFASAVRKSPPDKR